MRLHAKIILVLLPLIALPLATLGWVAYEQQRDSVQRDSVRQLTTVVREVARHFQARLNAARSDVVLFANSQILRRYLLIEDEAQRFRLMQPGILKLFASYQFANPEYYEIRIILPDGYEDTRASSGPLNNITDEEADTDYFRFMVDDESDLLTQFILNPDTQDHAILVSQRIELVDTSVDPVFAKPKLRGYLVVTMTLDFLRAQARDVSTGGQSHVFFADANGHILSDHLPPGYETGHPMPRHLSARLIRGIESGTLQKADIEQIPYVMRGRRLHDNLYVLAMYPETELLASTRRIAKVTLVLILGTILLTAALLYATLNSMLLGPLAKLGHAAREIGSGNPIASLGINRRDEIGQLATTFEAMSENLQSSHDQITYLANHDSLTGLPNRRMFINVVQRALVNARRHKETLALLFMDLDDFKRINDSLGHQAGDVLLKEIAERLTAVIRPDDGLTMAQPLDKADVVARLGGDEFILLLHDLGRPLDAASVASRLLDALNRPVVLDEKEVEVSGSIGITTFPDDASTAEELVKNADIAMYHAKEQGKNHYQFFTRSLNTELVRRLEMESDLRKAVARQQLFLHYQPQVDASTGRIVGVEALLRWQHPEVGVVPPNEFIPLAEESGLIIPIGNWVLREACRQCKAWEDSGLGSVPVAVNVSARQFSSSFFADTVREALEHASLSPANLDIELTESSVMTDPEAGITALRALNQLGVRISMDDFGTGYSSLSILRRLPIDCLKIDKSFVDEIVTEGDESAITTAIISMAKSLGLVVIAEGVEQLSQLSFLRTHGCNRIQGFLISRPVSSADMEQLLLAPSMFPPRSDELPSPPPHGLTLVR